MIPSNCVNKMNHKWSDLHMYISKRLTDWAKSQGFISPYMCDLVLLAKLYLIWPNISFYISKNLYFLPQQEQGSFCTVKDSLVEGNLFEISFSSDNIRWIMAELKAMWVKAAMIPKAAACAFVSESCVKPSVPPRLEAEVVIRLLTSLLTLLNTIVAAAWQTSQSIAAMIS